MSEIKLPIKINGDAEQIAAENLSGIVNRYLSRRDPQSEFVKHEVAIICGYINENPLPKNNLTQTVLIGKWQRHPENGLFIRASIVRIDSIDYDNILSLVEESEDGYIKWAYRKQNRIEDFKHFEPNIGLKLKELEKICALTREFAAVTESYEWIVDYRRRNL